MAILMKARKICQKLGFTSGILQKDTTKTYLAKYRFISMDYYNTIFAIIHSTIVSGTMIFNYHMVVRARSTFYLLSSV